LFEKIAATIITESVYTQAGLKQLKVPDAVYEKSLMTYLREPEKAKIYGGELDKIKAKYPSY